MPLLFMYIYIQAIYIFLKNSNIIIFNLLNMITYYCVVATAMVMRQIPQPEGQ